MVSATKVAREDRGCFLPVDMDFRGRLRGFELMFQQGIASTERVMKVDV